MSLPDYSEYLRKPGMLPYIESEWVNKPEEHRQHALAVNNFINGVLLKNKGSVIEIGCGSGQLATMLTGYTSYTGVDKNEEVIELCKRKMPKNNFVVEDIRTLSLDYVKHDLVICFGVLKHFGLHEWFDVFKKIASLGNYFIFNIPVAEQTKDDGTEYHHVWKSKQELIDDMNKAGLELLDMDMSYAIEPILICKNKKAYGKSNRKI